MASIDPDALRRDVEAGRFAGRFAGRLDRIAASHGFEVRLDPASLGRAISRWRMPGPMPDPLQRIVEAHGRMVREMVVEPALVAAGLSADPDPVAAAASCWPAGACLYLAMLALCHDAFGQPEPPPSPLLLDAATWWSIRETIAEDADHARPFLAYLLGLRPAWHVWEPALSA